MGVLCRRIALPVVSVTSELGGRCVKDGTGQAWRSGSQSLSRHSPFQHDGGSFSMSVRLPCTRMAARSAGVSLVKRSGGFFLIAEAPVSKQAAATGGGDGRLGRGVLRPPAGWAPRRGSCPAAARTAPHARPAAGPHPAHSTSGVVREDSIRAWNEARERSDPQEWDSGTIGVPGTTRPTIP